ncbi:DUF2076 domain-containing protein [Pedomonas mirosovicensis]|uniref:DUF2076 domain-containing protein n=1 Tax=Pedomonas mirosovicensis TaxID=2908641 RepID=UPI00216A4994|nr:DUF2076 domain-containing protein [Pedomonas mirosovicensis]MCH8685278.1 DUF2076 domain-containing protein [Pedomonas mirosovicensis]
MNDSERQVIDSLFARLRQVEAQSPPRDAEAERLIEEHLTAQPGASYYMAQTVIAQEQALEAAQARITELEREFYSRGGGGFLSSILGGRDHSYRSSPHQSYRAGPQSYQSGPWAGLGGARRYGYGAGLRAHTPGGGFLAGAAQTAMGVAGGVLIGNLIANAFSGHDVSAAEAGGDYAPGVGPGEDTGAAGSEVGGEDFTGDDISGDFGMDEF